MSADYERKLHGAVAQFVKEADKKYPNWSERNVICTQNSGHIFMN